MDGAVVSDRGPVVDVLVAEGWARVVGSAGPDGAVASVELVVAVTAGDGLDPGLDVVGVEAPGVDGPDGGGVPAPSDAAEFPAPSGMGVGGGIAS